MGRAAEKALARGRKSATQSHFCAENFVHEITYAYIFLLSVKFSSQYVFRSIVIEENVSSHLSG